MSKVNGVVNTITKIITWVLVVLLMLGIIGGVAYFALRSQGVTFYVEYGGEKYFAAGEGGRRLVVGGHCRFFSPGR